MNKTCTKCNITKPITDFYISNSKATKNNPVSGYKSHCKNCVKVKSNEYYSTEIGRKRLQEKSWKEKGIDMTVEEYENILKSQGGGCAICGRTSNNNGTRLCVDHNHSNGQVRGVLCHYCNTVLGKMNDDVELLKAAIAYLERSELRSNL